ncbi:MAG: hypothetical protein IPN51_03500 [Chloracidobacterium sp.]|nr:hypothetical protein [Chloracidobacterium sp.]
MQVCEPDVFRPSQIIDTEVEVLETAKRPLRTRQRIRLHIGTIEALARVTVLNNAGRDRSGRSRICSVTTRTVDRLRPR